MTRPEAGGGAGFPDEWNDYGDRERGTWFAFDDRGAVSRERDDTESQRADQRGWSEEQVPRYQAGDRVKITCDVNGVFTAKVPSGTEGRVVSTRDGIFTSYVTVAFTNGYTEEVKKSDLKKVGWFG
jgi:hypothetical protein